MVAKFLKSAVISVALLGTITATGNVGPGLKRLSAGIHHLRFVRGCRLHATEIRRRRTMWA